MIYQSVDRPGLVLSQWAQLKISEFSKDKPFTGIWFKNHRIWKGQTLANGFTRILFLQTYVDDPKHFGE